MENKTYYTPCRILNVQMQNNNIAPFMISRGTVCRVSTKDFPANADHPDGSFVVNASMCVNMRNGMINRALGTNFPTGSKDAPVEEATWVQLSIWNDLGRRFMKFLNGRITAQVEVMGTIQKREYTSRDGTQGVSVNMNVQEFWNVLTRKDLQDGAGAPAGDYLGGGDFAMPDPSDNGCPFGDMDDDMLF